MFEGGDIVVNDADGTKGIVLKGDDYMMHILLYDFSTEWVNVNPFRKIGSTYAIYRSMYDLNICEVR